MEKKEFIFPALLAIFCTAANIIWLHVDTTPQAWDESIHLQAASAFADTMRHTPLKVLPDFVTQENYYPPLVPFVASFFGLKSPDMDSLTYSMVLFHVLLIFSVFAYTRRRFDFLSACAASSMTTAFPLIFAQGHLLMLDLPLTAFTMLSVYLLSDPGLFRRKRRLALLGAVMGAAMLVKWTYWIFIIAPFIVRLAEEKKENLKIKISDMAVVFGTMFLTAGPWYLWHSVPVVSTLLMTSFSKGKAEGFPSIFTVESFVYYFKMLPGLLNPVFLPACLAGAVFIFAKKDKKNTDLVLYFIIPVLFMTFLQNKKDRYIMPALPFAAVAGSYLVYMARGKAKNAIAASAAISALALMSYFFSVLPFSFAWPYSARPNTGDWKITEILDKAKSPGQLVIVPDIPAMNNLNYGFYVKNYYPGLKVGGIYNFPMFADYFLIKTGAQGPVFTASDKREVITGEVLGNRGPSAGFYEKIYETALPDNSRAMLYKRKDRISVDTGKFESGLDSGAMGMLGLYLKGAKKFRFSTELGDGALVKSIRVGFKEGFAGDFKHKDAGLRITNADIEIKDLLLNPNELSAGRLSILSMGGIYIHSMEISASDLAAFALLYAKKAKDLKVVIDSGVITLSAVYSGIRLKAAVKLYNPSAENPDICVKIISLKAGIIGIPASLANFLIKDYNPLLNRSKSPVKLHYGGISAENGVLKIY